MDMEIGMYLAAIEETLDWIVLRSLQGLDAEAIRWKPLESANSLAAIAKHSLANAERNVLHTFAGEPYDWRRAEEFVADDETAETLRAHWEELRARMRGTLESMPATRLSEIREHPRMGAVPGRAVLLQAVRHANEHAGAAELTRDLVLALARR